MERRGGPGLRGLALTAWRPIQGCGQGWLQTGSGNLVKLFEYLLGAMGASPDGRHLAFAVSTPDRQAPW